MLASKPMNELDCSRTRAGRGGPKPWREALWLHGSPDPRDLIGESNVQALVGTI